MKKRRWHKAINVAVALALVLLAFPLAQVFVPTHADPGPDWWDANWKYRKKLTFGNSGQAENLVDFTVLVKLTSTNFDFSKAKANGEDIRFVDSDDSTELKYEIERWNSGSSVAEVWVKVPQIDASSATDYIWLYYGDASATDNQDVVNTWRTEWKTVTHLAKTGDDFDSISNTNAYVQTGTVQSVTGQIGLARNSDNGDTDYLLRAAFGDFRPITVMAWVNFDTTPIDYSRVFSREPSDSGGMDWEHGTQVAGIRWFVATSIDSIASIPLDTWTFVATTFNAGTGRIYFDGSEDTSGTITDGTYNNPLYLFRSGKGTGRYMDGMIDEFRMYNGELTAAWIKAEYLSTNDTFITFGSEEKNWESYNDAAHQNQSDLFDEASEDTVHMFGEGFVASTAYHVGYYDGDGAKILSDGVSSNSTGELSSLCYFPTYQESAVTGTWHAVVYQDSVASPPETYTANDPDSVVEDDFEVTAQAIPEFPIVIAGIAVAGLCCGIYLWMRRRRVHG